MLICFAFCECEFKRQLSGLQLLAYIHPQLNILYVLIALPVQRAFAPLWLVHAKGY